MDEDTTHFVIAIVTAATGLIGVALGGWISSYSQREERRRAFLRSQLDEFYSPMLGLRERILAKSMSRERVNQAADSAWRKLYDGQKIERQIELEKTHKEEYGAIIDYNNEQLFKELLPLYREMIDLFSKKMGLAEASTRLYFGEFVHFVDIWDRSEKNVLPVGVSRELGHSEANVRPFYDDLAANVSRIQNELKK
jgi:hypothetical protein